MNTIQSVIIKITGVLLLLVATAACSANPLSTSSNGDFLKGAQYSSGSNGRYAEYIEP